ncbi:hypothetical protein K474DRAFT_1769692 [Panus rudis PR-1116 ss-1]|nr:hypothetical protein K474DRAFT_1769692 [Panus rudis PR-1116 ss-1]
MAMTSGKRRINNLMWKRPPGFKDLPRNPPLAGDRPPNGVLWGHDPSEFCFISRYNEIPNVVTLWSRSQIRDLDENYTTEMQEALFDQPHFCPKPRRRRPWPVLKLPRTEAAKCDPPLGLIDEGSDHEDDWEVVLVDDPDEEQEVSRDDTVDHKANVQTLLPYSLLEDGWSDKIVKAIKYDGFTRSRVLVKASPGPPPSDIDVDVKTATADSNSDAESDSESEGGEHRTVPPAEKKEHFARVPGVYSIEGLPTLTEKIPRDYLPNMLLVHDPTDLTLGREPSRYGRDPDPVAHSTENKPFLYKRVYPPPTPTDLADNRKASLYLSKGNLLGTGHHSLVYASPLELPPPLTTYRSAYPISSVSSPSETRQGTVRVAAKLAHARSSARQMLHNEAEIYHSFPEHMSEEWCGYHVITPWMRSPVPSSAMVPKFFGYYVPMRVDKGDPDYRQETGGQVDESQGHSWEGRSPVLLVEDCGKPIDSVRLDVDARAECYSFIIRMHALDYQHNSFYLRNILIQPGPLTRAPSLRSWSTPSFRLIDFGRTETEKQFLESMKEKKADSEGKDLSEVVVSTEEVTSWKTKFQRELWVEWQNARRELGFDLVEPI